jgi:hypothetical protein
VEKSESANFIAMELKKIIMNYVEDTSNPETAIIVKEKISDYLLDISDHLNYEYKPEVVCEIEGPFLTLNFFTKTGERLETFGDLVYYMDTGENYPKA